MDAAAVVVVFFAAFNTHTHKKSSLSLSLFSLSQKKKQDQLTLLLPMPLEAQQAATLRLRFSYSLPDALEGLYRSTWTEEKERGAEGWEAEKEDANGSNPPRKTTVLRAAAVSQFEANSARTAFPCFDEPAIRAPFAVSLVADEGLAVISNMPEVSVEEVELEEVSESSRKRRKKKKAQNAPPFPPPPSSSSFPRPRRLRHVFEPTPAMPTYLVAVVVGPLGEFLMSVHFMSLFFERSGGRGFHCASSMLSPSFRSNSAPRAKTGPLFALFSRRGD